MCRDVSLAEAGRGDGGRQRTVLVRGHLLAARGMSEDVTCYVSVCAHRGFTSEAARRFGLPGLWGEVEHSQTDAGVEDGKFGGAGEG